MLFCIWFSVVLLSPDANSIAWLTGDSVARRLRAVFSILLPRCMTGPVFVSVVADKLKSECGTENIWTTNRRTCTHFRFRRLPETRDSTHFESSGIRRWIIVLVKRCSSILIFPRISSLLELIYPLTLKKTPRNVRYFDMDHSCGKSR